MRVFLFLIAASWCVFSCKTGEKPVAQAPAPVLSKNVGDILPDSTLDDPGFRLCRENNIPQYYMITSGYDGEKPAIERYFRENFKMQEAWEHENGYLTVRFVVNCNGRTGRFRVQEMGADYLPKTFPESLHKHLLELCKNMPGWLPGKAGEIPYDYYQYLSFTLVNGQIARITP